MKNNIYLALVHHPVYNKYNNVVTTSITNLDVHDIARSCCTFGLKKFFVINPLSGQKAVLDKITNFWETDIAKDYNSDRQTALELVEYATSIEHAITLIKNREDKEPCVVSTTAATLDNQIDVKLLAEKSQSQPILLLFGTGNGLEKSVHEKANFILKPILGAGTYNHLSVRSAVAILLAALNSEK